LILGHIYIVTGIIAHARYMRSEDALLRPMDGDVYCVGLYIIEIYSVKCEPAICRYVVFSFPYNGDEGHQFVSD